VLDPAGRLLLIQRTDSGLYALPPAAMNWRNHDRNRHPRNDGRDRMTIEATDLVGIYSDTAHILAFLDGAVPAVAGPVQSRSAAAVSP
jgi:hypothetical protein